MNETPGIDILVTLRELYPGTQLTTKLDGIFLDLALSKDSDILETDENRLLITHLRELGTAVSNMPENIPMVVALN